MLGLHVSDAGKMVLRERVEKAAIDHRNRVRILRILRIQGMDTDEYCPMDHTGSPGSCVSHSWFFEKHSTSRQARIHDAVGA